MSSPNHPKFLIDLEVQDLHTVDHASLAQSMLRGIKLAPQPFRIVLFGAWGSGKSTILRMLQEELERDGGEDDNTYLKTVWFNPWEHESSPNLMHSMVSQLTAEIPDGIRYSRKGSKVIHRVVQASEWIGRRWDEPTTMPHALRASVRGLDMGQDAFGEENDINQVTVMREAFRRFVDFTLVQGPKQGTRRLVIFIDDLDKCRPMNVLNMLEGLKLIFARQTNIVLVFALDKDVLCNAIEQKYNQRHNFDADRYIEKIFEFSYEVPTIAIRHLGPLVRELYERANLKALSHDDAESQSDLKALEMVLAWPGIVLNPRKIKRIFNKFIWLFASRKQLEIANTVEALPAPPNASDSDSEALEPEWPALIYWLTWLLTGEQWRDFRRMTSQYGEPAIAELCNRVTGNPIYPHSHQRVREEFDSILDLEGLVEYYRGVFDVGRGAHLPQIQERMKQRVKELVRIDRVLKLHGI